MEKAKTLLLVLSVCGLVVAGCVAPGGKQQKMPYNVTIIPSDFGPKITNQYLPLVVGTRFTYEGKTDEGHEKVEVYVTSDTKVVMGVTCAVVRDTLWVDGTMTESTMDFFAQATNGDVWYFGEECKEYKGGKVKSTQGSWEAGVNGALPGIIMPAVPQIGAARRLEYLSGVAEDMAEVLSLNKTVSVPYGTFTNCVETKDWSMVEPGLERKYYALGVGLIKEETVKGGWGKMMLTSITKE